MKTKIYAVIIWGFMMVLFTHAGYSQNVACQNDDASINSADVDAFNNYVIKFKKQGKHQNTDLKIIPLVIHVIYRNSADSAQITMDRILGQIDATNKQMRRLNANANETRELFLPVAADCNIQVCLATRKPDRSVFNGVLYHKYPDYNETRDLNMIRQATTLDHNRYLNVWVTPDGEFAKAAFPWQNTDSLDGFYVGATFFGITGSNLNPQNNLGVTFTHELAHYLGVLHTFDESTGYQYRCDLVNDASIGDFCADTPLDWDLTVGFNNCNDGGRLCDQDDTEFSFFVQSENYMYYAFDDCLNMFSKDQRARMRACLTKLRHQLTLPSNLKHTGINCKDLRGNCNSCPTPFVSSEGDNDLLTGKLATEKKIIIFPNPTNGIVHILYYDLPVEKSMIITVYSGMGQKLKEVHSGTAIQELNLGSLSEGIYYIRITIDDASITKYIIKGGLSRE